MYTYLIPQKIHYKAACVGSIDYGSNGWQEIKQLPDVNVLYKVIDYKTIFENIWLCL